MPTSDRATIKSVIAKLVDRFNVKLVGDPPTTTKPFRGLVVGETDLSAHPRPFVVLHLVSARPLAAVEDDRLFEVLTLVTAVTDDLDRYPYENILDQVGAIENYFDGAREDGLIEGAEGFDQRAWEFHYPHQSSGSRLIQARCKMPFIVKVERDVNQ